MNKRLSFLGYLTLCLLFSSCMDDSLSNSDTSFQEKISKEEVKEFFKSRNIDVSFQKPKYYGDRDVKTVFEFNSLQHLEAFLDSTDRLNKKLQELEILRKANITHVDNEGGGGVDSPSFVQYSKSIFTPVGPLYLNMAYVLDSSDCEPDTSTFSSWITGNLHISDYEQQVKICEKGGVITTDSGEYYPIYSGVIGVVNYKLKLAGLQEVYKSDNVVMNKVKKCSIK